MILHWNSRMAEKGMKGLYVAEMLTSFQKSPFCKCSDAVVEFEPMYTIGGSKSIQSVIMGSLRKRLPFLFRYPYRIFNYDKVLDKIVNRKKEFKGKTVFSGAFTDWDNSPRFGEKAAIFKNASSERFRDFLLMQARKSKSEFIFINAWNEWAEGAYLEPDLKNGKSYLNAVKEVYDECSR
jgi:hypothetical protein